MPKKYTSISIPVGLTREVEKLFQELEDVGIDLGYASLSDFTRDSLRRLIEQIRESHLNSRVGK